MPPYRDQTAKRLAARERKRRERVRSRSAAVLAFTTPDDPVGELAGWSRDVLKVPPGHPRAGEPMELPPFAVDFLRAGFRAHESALCVARKNAKSAICAVLALGFLAGPLRQPGWRGAVASLSKEKANELRVQLEAIAVASGLEGLRFRRAPYPGRVESSTGTLEILSSDRAAGHASGFDLVVCDETGLMAERSRELLAGLRSSVSAKNGRVVHISVRGDSPLYAEILANPASITRIYQAPEGCAVDDESAWRAANPGLGSVKAVAYMRSEVERIRGVPTDEPSFRAFDLNQRLDPTREMICVPADLQACFVDELPAREGVAFVGFDFGEATSATAAAAIWPATGRCEFWMAFGDGPPPIAERARRDGADYQGMIDRGELHLYPGRVVHPDQFLADVQTELAGVKVEQAAADGFKDSEVKDFLDRAAVRWPIEFRRVGSGKTGSADVRALQRLVLTRKLRMLPSVALVTAISKSTLRRDQNGNPALDQAHSRGRIDLLSALVISAGLAAPVFDRAPRRRTVKVSIVR